MADYQVICVERSNGGKGHIVALATQVGQTKKKWTVSQVRTAISGGDKFHTVSPTTGKKAYIEPFNIPTLRTKPDQVTDNNLDHLRPCVWTK